MGTDITLRVEHKKDGKWTYLPKRSSFTPWAMIPVSGMSSGTVPERDMGTVTVRITGTVSDNMNYFWLPRDYKLFGILANVRNPGVQPIANPRGWPSDMDDETLNSPLYLDDEMILDPQIYHSKSWLLLSEILDYYDVSDEKWKKKKKAHEKRKADIEDTLFEEFVELLDSLQKLDDPKNIRLIFGFDS